MMKSSDERRPKVRKQAQVTARMRRQIVTGQLPPSSRLPTRRELEAEFGVSPLTIHHAIGRLVRDGFIEARGKLGTFVVDHPPHLSNLTLVFPIAPGHEGWTRFWTALANEAIELSKLHSRNISVIYGIDGHADNEDYQKLVRDVRAHRVAGLIFPANPFQVRNTPLLSEPNMAYVSVDAPSPDYPESSVVLLDAIGLLNRALGYFADRNRRKLAIIQNTGLANINEDQLRNALERFGIINRPHWRMGVSLKAPHWARNAVNMMMRGPVADRPDALLIMDDNLVEYATFGLVDAGVSVPNEVEVVAHCNFPWPTPSVQPLRRLGYDSRAVLRACIASIDRQREGKPAPPVTRIEAQFEEEVHLA